MTSAPTERKLAAILSADVVGYSRLMAEDEAGTIRTLTDYREEIAMLVRQHRGRVVDSPGDNVLAEFPTATDAVSCAFEIQGVLNVRNAPLPKDRKMEFRIGVHLGEVRVEGERIYGDGVNIAARLEGLAEPGGICVSSTVHEQIERKLNVALEDLGERTLKNVARPVHVYGVKLLLPKEKHEAPQGGLPGMADLTVPGFSGRPAIAVLPFDNLSGDPEQEYFADGIAEDLITRLSLFRDFPVIARNSSFVYRGKAVDVKRVSRELGVRYVVEGSVRRAGDRVRVSAQLIDATTGHHVWAERFDREMQDLFALQDEITEAIVGSMEPELYRAEQKRAVRGEPQDLDAWDCVMRAGWYMGRTTKDDNSKARSLLERAIELDPQSCVAFDLLALSHLNAVWFQWTDSPIQSVAELNRAARSSVELDSGDALGQVAMAAAYSLTGQPGEMIAASERAIELNPSLPSGYLFLGGALAITGRPDEAVATFDKGMRLSPRDPGLWTFFWLLGMAHFAAKRYEEAVEWARRSLRGNSRWPATWRTLAASYAHLGRIDEARGAFEEMSRLQPGYSSESARLTYASADPDYVERYIGGLRTAGLPE
jgi:adenylate cyclase